MGKTSPLTIEQQETLRLVYAQTESFTRAAEAVGCSVSTAHRYITQIFPNNDDGFEDLRTDMKVSILDKMKEVQRVYLEEMMKPERVKQASPRDLSAIFETVTKNAQLLSGKATERFESTVKNISLDELTPAQRKEMAKLRAKLAEGEQTPVADIVDETLVEA